MRENITTATGGKVLAEHNGTGNRYEPKSKAKQVAGLVLKIKNAKGLSNNDIAKQSGLSTTLVDSLLYLDRLSPNTLKKLKAWAAKV